MDSTGGGQPERRHAVDRGGDRRARRERLERRAEAALGQQRRVDAARELAQLLDGQRRLLACLGDQRRGRLRVRREPRLGHAERERQRHEPLLGAVVQVALDPAALGVAGGDDAGARVAQAVDPLVQLHGARAEHHAGEQRPEPGEPVAQMQHEEHRGHAGDEQRQRLRPRRDDPAEDRHRRPDHDHRREQQDQREAAEANDSDE